MDDNPTPDQLATLMGNLPVVRGGLDQPLPAERDEARGPTAPAGEVQQESNEPNAEPRQAAADASQQDSDPRIPKRRLDQEIAAKKKLQEERDSLASEIADLREKYRKAEFDRKVAALASGQGRPSDWDLMTPDQQDSWRLHTQAELIRDSMSASESSRGSESSELMKRLERLEFQTSLGMPPEQAAFIAELREQTGLTDITELKALAAMRQPSLFSGGSGDAGSSAPFQQSPGGGGRQPAQRRSKDNQSDLLTELANAPRGPASDLAGAKFISNLIGNGGLVRRPKGLI